MRLFIILFSVLLSSFAVGNTIYPMTTEELAKKCTAPHHTPDYAFCLGVFSGVSQQRAVFAMALHVAAEQRAALNNKKTEQAEIAQHVENTLSEIYGCFALGDPRSMATGFRLWALVNPERAKESTVSSIPAAFREIAPLPCK
ncbi:MAG: hypothetical protein ABJQ78_16640 [Alloalcanivorax sp.]